MVMALEIVLPPEYRRTASGGALYSEIEIHSSQERIWEILADFSRYPEWNPFIRSIRGGLAEADGSLRSSGPPVQRG